jgi:rod shape determining protein RodA
MRQNERVIQNADWITILLYFGLIFLGWANIYAAVFDENHSSIFDLSQRYGKQLMWIGTSIIIIIFLFILDGNLFQTLAYPIYTLSMASLFGVLLFGKEIAGARSWFAFGGFSIQPSEFAKFATALALAAFLGKQERDLSKWSNKIRAFAIIALPAALIIPQPDPGSALVYFSLFLVLYREGLSSSYLFGGFSMAILFLLSLLIPVTYLQIALAAIGIIIAFLGRKVKG